MTEIEVLRVLNAVNGLGNVRIKKLCEKFGSAQAVLSAGEKNLNEISFLPSRVAGNISQFEAEAFLASESKFISKNNIKVVSFFDDEYPSELKEIADAPVILYYLGDLPSKMGASLAIVGSRMASLYGSAIAGRFAERFAELGIKIVSGMARGIDTAAHKGALLAQGETYAVFGCGLAHVYPSENETLMHKIAESGAVISEFPIYTSPSKFTFPRRNRIISGLSKGVVVVEAAQKSGALITADFALEQGREVYAVPGKVDSITSNGVNNLIKQGAKLVSCVEDVLEDLSAVLKEVDEGSLEESSSGNDFSEGSSQAGFLSDSEKLIMDNVKNKPLSIDELVVLCDTDVSSTMSNLLNLEMRNLVKQTTGKLFVRN